MRRGFLWMAAAAATLCASAWAGPRTAPMILVESRSPGGLELGAPRIVDRPGADGSGIEGFLFTIVKAPAGLARADAVVRLEPPTGGPRVFRSRVGPFEAGAQVRLGARLALSAAAEGAFRATVTVSGAEGALLFEGFYTFGYPRYEASHGLMRVSTSATIRDDFSAETLNERLWRVWTSDPGRVRMRQMQGRFWIDVTGPAGYNGLVSRVEMATRDVEAVCRAGLTSSPQAKHAGLVHVCGSGPLSPDHWLEVQLRAPPGGVGSATVNVAVPPERHSGYRGGYELPGPPADGYLIRIVCDGATNFCRGYALAPGTSAGAPGEWWQLGDGFEVPARRTRLEIKASGWAEPGGSSRIWFDDCRVYPRPQTHYVTVVLTRADGRPPGTVCFDPGNAKVEGCDLAVKLYDADGRRLIDEAHTGVGFGYALLRIDRSGWDVYPVPAVIRVLANGKQIGPDHSITASGVDGLYPDDVYTITLD